MVKRLKCRRERIQFNQMEVVKGLDLGECYKHKKLSK